MNNKTFMMIKPDEFERGLTGKILPDIPDAGFKIIELINSELKQDIIEKIVLL